MYKLVIILSLFAIGIPTSKSSNLKLTQDIFTRYLKYSFQPKTRNVFKSASLGMHQKLKERTFDNLRRRVSPMLKKFKELSTSEVGNKIFLNQYNPTLKHFFVSMNKLEVLAQFNYPANIRWMTNKTSKMGKEFIEVSIKSRPSIAAFKNFMNSIEQVLKLNLGPALIQGINGRKLTDREKEMLEPIKEKSFKLSKYQQFYGVYYKFDGYVEADYFGDLKKHLKLDFANIQELVKSNFNRSRKINMAINAKLILNLEKAVEEEEFKSLDEPFLISRRKLAKTFYRFSKHTEVSEVIFLVAKKSDSESVIPVLNDLLDPKK